VLSYRKVSNIKLIIKGMLCRVQGSMAKAREIMKIRPLIRVNIKTVSKASMRRKIH